MGNVMANVTGDILRNTGVTPSIMQNQKSTMFCVPSLIRQLACCFGSAACSFCCIACPSCKNSTSSRLMYAVMVAFIAILSCILLAPGLQNLVDKIPFCCKIDPKCVQCASSTMIMDCRSLIGYLAVYRVCFITTLFFLLMALIMFSVDSSRDWRAGVQNGFWAIKFMLVIGGIIGAYFIPVEILTWLMYVGLVGGSIFIMVQMTLMVDIAHRLGERLVGSYRKDDSCGTGSILLFFTFLQYAAALAGFGMFAYFYISSGGCALNISLIAVNLVICIIISVVSILQKVQEHSAYSGLFQSSAISLYIMYLTWSAMLDYPESSCKLNTSFLFNGGKVEPTAATSKDASVFNVQTVASLIIWFLTVLYYSVRISSRPEVATKTESEKLLDKDAGDILGKEVVMVWDNEGKKVVYSWSKFHLVLAMATLYLMMILTNGYSPDSLKNSDFTLKVRYYTSMWTQICSSWICAALYVWTLVAPILYPDRIFS